MPIRPATDESHEKQLEKSERDEGLSRDGNAEEEERQKKSEQEMEQQSLKRGGEEEDDEAKECEERVEEGRKSIGRR